MNFSSLFTFTQFNVFAYPVVKQVSEIVLFNIIETRLALTSVLMP